METRIPIRGAHIGFVSARSDRPVSSEQRERILQALDGVFAEAPVERGEHIVYNIGDTGVDFIAQRRIPRK